MALLIARESVLAEAAGSVKWASADLYDRAGEIVITIRFTSPELAEEAYEAIASDLEQDGFRVGSLNLRVPSSVEGATHV